MRATQQTPAAPSIFGAAFGATGFGAAAAAAGGFDPSKFASAAPAAKAEDGDEGEGEGDEDVEAECKAEFKPVVKLEIIEGAEATTTGEEDEDILFEAYVFERSRVCVCARAWCGSCAVHGRRAREPRSIIAFHARPSVSNLCFAFDEPNRKVKSYRFTDGEWKERGLGPIKLLEHKTSKKIRVLMRRDKTLKICANFYVQQESKVAEHAASEKACVFTTMDCSDGDVAPELYNMCIKFGSAEKREAFTEAFNAAQKKMAALPADADAEEKAEEAAAVAEEADKLADAFGETKVAEEKKEEE